MEKNIYFLNDQIVHWNIVPKANREIIFKELWGVASTKRLLDFLEPISGGPFDGVYNLSLKDVAPHRTTGDYRSQRFHCQSLLGHMEAVSRGERQSLEN